MSNKQVFRIHPHDHTPKQRVFMKKVGNKQLRKQHEKILKEELLNLANELPDYSQYVWEGDNYYEDSYDYYLDQNPEYGDEYYDASGYGDDYADWMYDPYDYDPYWGDDRMTHDDISQLAQDKVIITEEDCGKTLGQLMREHLLR